MALGLCTIGSEIAFLPVTDFSAPINRVVFPGYARVANNPDDVRQKCREVIGLLGMVALPTSIGVAAIAEPLVATMLGNNWGGAVILLQILAVTGAFHAVTSNHYAAWLALGKTGVVAFVGAIQVALLAYAELSATGGAVLVECIMLSRALRLSIRSYLAGLWRPVTAAAVMAVAVVMVRNELGEADRAVDSMFQLAVAIPIGVATYASILILLWTMAGRPLGAESLVIQRALQAWSRVRGRMRETNR